MTNAKDQTGCERIGLGTRELDGAALVPRQTNHLVLTRGFPIAAFGARSAVGIEFDLLIRGNNQPTVGRVRLVHNNRPTGVDHSSHGVPMQIASIMLRGPAEAGRQRLVGVGFVKTDSTNPWRFTDRLDPERRRRPASIDPRSRLSSFDTTTTSRDQQSSDRTPIPDRPAGEARGSAARTPSWSMAAGSHSSKTAPHHMGDWRGTSCRRLVLLDLVQ